MSSVYKLVISKPWILDAAYTNVIQNPFKNLRCLHHCQPNEENYDTLFQGSYLPLQIPPHQRSLQKPRFVRLFPRFQFSLNYAAFHSQPPYRNYRFGYFSYVLLTINDQKTKSMVLSFVLPRTAQQSALHIPDPQIRLPTWGQAFPGFLYRLAITSRLVCQAILLRKISYLHLGVSNSSS